MDVRCVDVLRGGRGRRRRRGNEDEAHGLREFVAMNEGVVVSEGVGCAAVTTGTEDGDSGRLAAATIVAARSEPLPSSLLLEGESATDEAVMDEGERTRADEGELWR